MAREQKQDAALPSLAWVPCATCWGQRKLVTLHAEGVVLEETCPTCLGVGESLRETTQR